MRGFFIKWLVNIVALVAVINVVPGIHSDRLEATIVAALILGLINAFLRPLVIIFTLPLTILTLGLFTLFINGFMLYLVSKIVEGFNITGFWSAFWGALCFSVISFLLNIFISPQGTYRYEIPPFHERARRGRSGRRFDGRGVIDTEAEVDDKEEGE
jgi:putative membrane protein